MSWVAVSCHRCGGMMRVESSLLARQVTCTRCHATMPVPPGIEPASGEVLPPSAAPPDASSRHELSPSAPPASGEPPVPGQTAASRSRGAVSPPPSPDESRGQIVVPTEDGERITLHEPVKIVQWGTENRELRQVDPKERSRRRFRRNVIMWCLGASILLLTALVLLRIS